VTDPTPDPDTPPGAPYSDADLDETFLTVTDHLDHYEEPAARAAFVDAAIAYDMHLRYGQLPAKFALSRAAPAASDPACALRACARTRRPGALVPHSSTDGVAWDHTTPVHALFTRCTLINTGD